MFDSSTDALTEMDAFFQRNHASFIQKPYGTAELTKVVRDCLDKNGN